MALTFFMLAIFQLERSPMENPIKQIVRFNREAGLLDKGYDDFLESSFQIEEALEGFSALPMLADRLQADTKSPKDLSRIIVRLASGLDQISDVDRLDKACDAVVFAIGSMAKLGLDANQITRALNTVMRANFTKLGMPKDEHGKQLKPADFVGPEAELAHILEERTCQV
jgi:predicted HAD superfamily Cof-like phosphohydrolase